MKSWRSRVAAVVAAAAVTIPLTVGSASASVPTDPDGFHLAGGSPQYQSCMDEGQSGLGQGYTEYQCRWNPSSSTWEVWVRSTNPKDGYIGGRVYLFDGHDNTGDVLAVDPVDIPYIDWAWNDRASSVWNLSSSQICIWTDADHHGYSYSIPAGAKQELLYLYDNAVSSLSVGGC
ncbi:peptidase inhibitor family I36 protein [Streptomyces sp. NPDC001443]